MRSLPSAVTITLCALLAVACSSEAETPASRGTPPRAAATSAPSATLANTPGIPATPGSTPGTPAVPPGQAEFTLAGPGLYVAELDGLEIRPAWQPPEPAPPAVFKWSWAQASEHNLLVAAGGCTSAAHLSSLDMSTGEKELAIVGFVSEPISSLDGASVLLGEALERDERTGLLEARLIRVDSSGGAIQDLGVRGVLFSPSPDLRQVAYIRIATRGTGDLWLHDLETDESRLLVERTAYARPVWDRAGERLAFETGSSDLALIPAAGSGPTTLVELGFAPSSIVWAADGRAVIFAGNLPGGSPENAIILAPSDGSPVEVLAEGHSLSLSADGRTAAVFRPRGGLGVIDLENRSVEMLAVGLHLQGVVSVSPDGSKVVFNALGPGGRPDLYVIDRDGGNLRYLVAAWSRISRARWSPDGRYVAFEDPAVRECF